MSTHRAVRLARSISDRAIRILLSVALLVVYMQFDLAKPAEVVAAPAALSVTASVSAKPLLGGKATVQVTVKNTDIDSKAYNISVENTITSNNATAYATFVSASDANGALPPSVNALNIAGGSLSLGFINIRDLAPGESYSMDILVDIGPSSAWKVGDLLQNAVRASGNTIPNQTIPDLIATTTASAAVLPIIVKTKSTNQSTGVEQATGTTSRKYSYTVEVQNNYSGPTQNVIVVDQLDDGIQFLGMNPASTWTTAPVESQSPTSGITTLTWNLGTMPTSGNQKIIYDTGIRYDYFGTDSTPPSNNRPDTSPLTSATAGTLIPDKTTLHNNVRLDATWQSNPASDTANSPVTAAYLTIAKRQTPGSGGSIDTTISYTLDYCNSQYYSILATAGSILVHDHLPDGQIFETATAVPAPTSTQHNADGSTDITWTVGAMTPTDHGVITFDASVQQNWQDPALGGDPVVSGDTMTNTCDIRGIYQDEVRTARPQALSTSSASSGYSTSVPKIYKAMKDPEDPSGPWLSNIKMSIGDTTTVRVQFNTKDGINPERTNIDMGNIMLNDWLPAGMSIVPGSFNVTYSAASDFSTPTTNPQTPNLNILTPTLLNVSGLEGAQWFIGNVKPAGWWQATFDVTVADVPAAGDGIIVANLWKLTGYNTANTPYSDRAAAMTINYADPYLVLTKSVSPPTPLSSGSQVPYTIAIANTGTGRAHQVSITDTLPVGMRTTAPVVDSVKMGASTLTSGTDYLTSWETSTGTLAVLLNETTAATFGQSPPTLVVDYTATVDAGIGAGAALVNTATVSYSSAPNLAGHVTPGTNNVADDNTKAASITLDPLKIGKAKVAAAGALTIGDTATYDITFTVPAHDVAYSPVITDSINRQGFRYAPGTAGLTLVSPGSATASLVTSIPVQSFPTGSSTAFTWNLAGPIDNSAGSTPATFKLSFGLTYVGLLQNNTSWEFSLPASQTTGVDTARIDWNATPSGTPKFENSTAVTTNMGQPVLAVTKALNPLPAPLPIGGSTINYRVTIKNNGSQPAYNVSLDDTLPLEATSSVMTSASMTGTGSITSQITTSYVTGPPPAMRFVLATSTPIAAGQTATIDYAVTLSTNVAAGAVMKNIADADWNSLPGAPPGSRIYNDSPQEAYTGDLASITVNARAAAITKTVTSGAGPYTFGQIATYTVDVTVPPHTVLYWPRIRDQITGKLGAQYVVGSASVTDTAGTPDIGAQISAISTGTTGANSFIYVDLNNPGPLHAIVNTSSPAAYTFKLTFAVRVTGVNGATWEYPPVLPGTGTMPDTATQFWNATNQASRPPTTGAGTYSNSLAANASINIAQPLLKLTKSVQSGPGPYSGSDSIDYRLVIANPGSSAAFDISAIDTLPVEIAGVTTWTATQSGVGTISPSVTASYTSSPQPHIHFDFDPAISLPGSPATGTITVNYTVQLKSTVGAGSVMTNTADVNWASLSGPVPGRRVYNDSSQEASWTQDTTTAIVAVAPVTLTKRITSGLTTATIGTIIPYTIEATVPLNTTAYGLTMTDTVPPGLEVVALSSSPLAPSPAVISTGPAGSVVVWNTGAAGVTNPTSASAILTVWCQVRDTSLAGGPVPSGPIPNSAQMSWRTQLGAGSVMSTATAPVTFNVVQPSLSITKSASVASASASDTVTFTSVVRNASGANISSAYNMKWNDVLPSTMTNPVLLDVKHSGIVTTLTAGDYSTSVVGNTLFVSLDNTASAANVIAPGETVTIRFTGSVNGGARNGTSMVDTATVSSYTSLPTTSVARTYAPTSTTAAVNALAPALMATKAVIGGTGFPLAGETVHYQLKVWNVGTTAAHSVTVTDTLPGTQTYLAPTTTTWPANSSSVDPTITGGGRVLNWNWGDTVSLSTNETLTVDYWATVPSSEPTGTYLNTFLTGAVDAAGVPVFKPAALNGVLTDLNPTDSATATVRVVQPGILVTKTVEPGQDMFVQKGQAVGWRVTVTNTGDTTLSAPIPLADTYDPLVFQYLSSTAGAPGGSAGNLTWNLAAIGPGKKRSVDMTFTVLSVPPSNVGTNVATSAGVVDEFGHPVASSADTATVGITRPQVSVNKVLTSDPIVQAGEPVTFDIGITNTGDQILASVPVTDTSTSAVLTYTGASLTPSSTLPAGTLHWNNIGSLLVGQTTTITVSYVASSAPVGNTTTNTVTVSGVDVHSDSAPSTSTAATVRVTRPHVMVTKSLAQTDTVVQQGQDVVYTLTVKNDGDTTLSSFNLSDTWESGVLGYVSSSPAGSNAANTASWTIGPLAPNASTVVTLTLSALAVPSGQITTDTASVSGTDVNGDPAPGTTSSASVRITHPAVSVTKTLNPLQDPQVQVGENVVFDIVVKNEGDTTLTTVPLADAYDAASLTYLSAIPSANTSSSGNVNWTHVATLAPGTQTTVTATFRAIGVPVGQITTDTVSVISAIDQYGDNPANATGAASVRITAPAISIGKVLASADHEIQVGELATFDITVTNTGDTTLSSIVATDTWDPAVFGFDSSSPLVPGASGVATWAVPPLAPAGSYTFSVTLEALASPVGLTANDTATVSAIDVYGDHAGPASSSAGVLITRPALTVSKALNGLQDPVVRVGDNVTFDLTVQNSGNTTLTTVPLDDAYDSSILQFTGASVLPSSSAPGVIDWTNVGPLSPGASTVITATFKTLAIPGGQVTTDTAASKGATDIYNDTTDPSSADASVRITNPAVGVTKALHAGQDPAVQAGEPVLFDIVVTNTGDTTMTTVPLTDTYDSARLAYASALPSENTSAAGTVHWNNLGTLTPGQSTTVTATFTALSNPPGQVTTDTARVSGATDIYTDVAADASASAGVKVTAPSLTLTKTRTTDAAIQTSETVTFSLTVHNTGDTTLTAVPLTDNWDPSYLLFSASAPPTTAGLGFASWDVAPIAPGGSASVSLTLVALGPVPGLTTVDTATVVGAKDENNDAVNDAVASDSVDITKPAVSVNKVLHAGQVTPVRVGQTVTYDIGVTNSGDTTLSTVPLADAYDAVVFGYQSSSHPTLSAGGGLVEWANLGTILPGDTTTVTVTFTALASTAGAESADTATVSAAKDVNNDPVPDASDVATAQVTAPGVDVTKTLSSTDGQIQAGQTATFSLVVRNTGDTTLTTLPLSDTWDDAVFDFDSASLPPAPLGVGSAAWTLGPLVPSAQTTVTLTLRAKTSPVGLVTTDTAVVSATDIFGDPAGPATSTASVLVTRPGVTITKNRQALQDSVIQVGQNVTYDLHVTNSGNTTLTAVAMGDLFDATALQFQSASLAPSSSVPAGVLVWGDIGTLAPSASTTITVTLKAISVPSGQLTTDTASVVATDTFGDPAGPSSATADVRITAPAVSITKAPVADQDPAIQAGESASFDIVVTNTGDTRLDTVPLDDTYQPAYLLYTGASRAEDSSTAATLHWDNVGPLNPSQSTTVTVHFSAITNPVGQVTTDTAAVSAATDQYGDHPADVWAEASVKVTAPSLTLTKTRTTDAAIQTSQTVTFDLTVENTGDTTLTTVPLADTWDPAYLLFDSSLPPTVAGLGSASWDIAPIPPGTSITLSLTLMALGPVPGLTTTDTATVVGAKDENNDAANDAVASDSVDITKPAVSVNKVLPVGQDTHIQPGENVVYDLVVKNTGDTTLTTVPLSDAYDAAHLSYGGAAPSENSSSTGVLTWNNVGPLNVGQTTTVTVTFSATATGTSIPDTATITGAKDSNNDPAPDVSDTNKVLRITAPGVSITKAPVLGQDIAIQAGQTAAFDLVVTNTGDTTLTATTISDTWDGAVFDYNSASMTPDTTTTASATFSLPVLAPGATHTVTLTLMALASPVGLVSTDTAGVSATDEFGDHPVPDTATATQIVTRPAIGVVKSLAASQDTVIQVGQTVTYDIVVTNTGDTTLTTVPLADTYDGAALEPLSATPPATDLSNDGTLDWADLGQLVPNQTTTVTVTFEALSVPAGQVTTDTATTHDVVDYYSDNVADATSSADVRITAPAVSITKAPVADQDPAIQAGESASFDIVVTNTGDTRLDTVPLDDTYQPAYLLYTGASRAEDSSTAATLHWDNVGPLNPSQSTTVTVHFSAITNPVGQVTTDTAAVSAATDQYGDHPADVWAEASVKVTAPSLTLTKTLAAGQDPQIQAGQVATFTLTVRNTGDTTLTTVPLADSWDSSYLLFHASLPPATTGLGFASWDVAPIGPGESATVDLALMALQSVPGYVTTDTASVTGALDENDDSANDAIATAEVDITRPSVAVYKQLTAGQDPFVQVGQTVTYDIVVTNDGDITLASVPLSDVFDPAVFAPSTSNPPTSTSAAGSVGWASVGPLLPGEITTVTVTMVAIGTSGGAASVDTATVANARDINDDPATDTSATAAVTVTRPEVAITKKLSAGQAPTIKLGDNVSYDLVVTNTGDTTLTTLPLTDDFQASQLAFVSAAPAQSTIGSGTVSWSNVASPTALAPGAVTTVTATFRTLSAGNALADLATIADGIDIHDDSVPDTSSPNTVLSVFDPGALEVTKTADPVAGTIMLPGQTITYTLAWNNTGGVAIPDVLVTDPLPDSVVYVPGSLKLSSTSQSDPVDSDAGSFNPATRTVLLDLGTVGAESSGMATFQVTVAPEELSKRGVANTAGFSSAGSSIATAGPIHHPVDPFTIAKVGKDLNGGALKGGDVIEWTITVTNIGLTPTTHVKVTDAVPNTTTYVNRSITGVGANDSASPNLVWNIGQMGVNEVQVLTFRSTVKKGLKTGTQIKNQATVSSDQSLPKHSDNPLTPTNGDWTILVARTSGSEGWRYPLAAGLLALIAWAWRRPKRLLAENITPPRTSDRKGGGLGD